MEKNKYSLIFYYLSIFIILIGIIIMFPLILLPFYPSELQYAYCFIIPGICTIFIGYLLYDFNNLDKANKTKVGKMFKMQNAKTQFEIIDDCNYAGFNLAANLAKEEAIPSSVRRIHARPLAPIPLTNSVNLSTSFLV